MNKYPLVKLFSQAFGGTKRPTGPAVPGKPKQSRQAAQEAILQAKEKRARKQAKRAAVINQE